MAQNTIDSPLHVSKFDQPLTEIFEKMKWRIMNLLITVNDFDKNLSVSWDRLDQFCDNFTSAMREWQKQIITITKLRNRPQI